jgi:hypothetical protein
MRTHVLLTVSAVATALAGCATRSASSSEAETAPQVTSSTADIGPLRWTGNLQPMQQRSPSAIQPAERTKAYGTVLLSVSPQTPNRTRAQITLTVPLQSATELRWAILSGRCGAASLPVAGYEQFPVLEMSANGRGQLDTEIPVTLATTSTYHVNIYWSGHDLANVLTCATLRREGSR